MKDLTRSITMDANPEGHNQYKGAAAKAAATAQRGAALLATSEKQNEHLAKAKSHERAAKEHSYAAREYGAGREPHGPRFDG